MIWKLISLTLLGAILYILSVFFYPQFADQYWDPEINAKIREYKNLSLEFASGWENPISIIDKLKNNSEDYIYETKRTYENIQNTISGKVQDVKTAADSVEKAYQAVNAAKQNIEKVVNTASWNSNQ